MQNLKVIGFEGKCIKRKVIFNHKRCLKMIEARFKMDEYTKRVLDVIKGKYGLSNRSQALRQLIESEGYKYMEPDEAVLNEIDAEYKNHRKKHPNRKMKDKELRTILNV